MISSKNHPHIDCALLQKQLLLAKSDKELFQQIVNAPFIYNVEVAWFFLGIIALLLVNKETGTINRIALSNTELAKNAVQVSVIPFKKIKIPVNYPENIIAQAIKSGEPRDTTDWKFLLAPILKPDEARINQASAGIAYSAVYPLQARDGGALIFSYYQYQQSIGLEQRDFMEDYTRIVTEALRV